METVTRNSSEIEANAFISTIDKLPRFSQWVRVVANGDRCLGFLSPEGVWRDVHSGCPLDNVEFWRSLEDDPRARTEVTST